MRVNKPKPKALYRFKYSLLPDELIRYICSLLKEEIYCNIERFYRLNHRVSWVPIREARNILCKSNLNSLLKVDKRTYLFARSSSIWKIVCCFMSSHKSGNPLQNHFQAQHSLEGFRYHRTPSPLKTHPEFENQWCYYKCVETCIKKPSRRTALRKPMQKSRVENLAWIKREQGKIVDIKPFWDKIRNIPLPSGWKSANFPLAIEENSTNGISSAFLPTSSSPSLQIELHNISGSCDTALSIYKRRAEYDEWKKVIRSELKKIQKIGSTQEAVSKKRKRKETKEKGQRQRKILKVHHNV